MLRDFLVTGQYREPGAEGLRCKKGRFELAAIPALSGGHAFRESGKSIHIALDGREDTVRDAAEKSNVPDVCDKKLADVVNNAVFEGISAKGPTKERLKVFLALRPSYTATKKDHQSCW